MARRKHRKRRRIHFSSHALQRLKEPRQHGIYKGDVIRACYHIKWIFDTPIPEKTKVEGLVSRTGRPFHIVVVDIPEGVRIVTVVGKKQKGRDYDETE